MAAVGARRPGINIFDTSRPLWRTMLVFLVPMMLSNVLQSLSQTFGNIYLGRLLGVDALAEASGVFPLFFLLFSFLIGIANGSTVLIGQAFGSGDHHRVKKIAGTVLGATFGLGIIVAFVGDFGSPWLLHELGTPSNIIGPSIAYARLIFFACPLFFPYIAYTTFLRGTGDAQTPFYFLIVSTVLQLIITPAFILGWFGLPKLGVLAAAVGGPFGQILAFGAFLYTLHRMKHPLKFDAETARDMLIDWKLLWSVLKIGVPTGLQVMMVALAEIALIRFVNAFGSHATAAYGAVNQVVAYVQFPAISIGITASIFGAQCIGARREDMLNSVIRSAVALNYLIGGVLILACYLLSWFVLGWFITDAHTLGIAHSLLMITLWSYLLFGNSAVLSGVMRSSGTVLWPTINGIFAIWAIEVPVAYILMRHYGLEGIWVGYPVSYCVVLVLQFFYYERFWKRREHKLLT